MLQSYDSAAALVVAINVVLDVVPTVVFAGVVVGSIAVLVVVLDAGLVDGSSKQDGNPMLDI
jgi:hypothetical protein